MENAEDAKKAIEETHNSNFEGATITVTKVCI